MGVETLLLAQMGLSLVGSLQEQGAARDQFEAEQEEFNRQIEEQSKIAGEQASDRAREGAKQVARAIAAMEAIGGAGSQNEARLQAEIAGTAGLDLARIRGNSRSRIAALESSKAASRQRALGNIQESRGEFLGSALDLSGGILKERARKRGLKDKEQQALHVGP